MYNLDHNLNSPPDNISFIQETLLFEKSLTKTEMSSEFRNIMYLNHNYDITQDYFEIFCSYSRFRIFGRELVKNFYYQWFNNSIKGVFDNIFGYVKNEKLLGFCTYRISSNALEIGLIGVFKGFQNQNVGRELIRYAVFTALKHDKNKMTLETQSENSKAIKFYTNNGFRLVDRHYWYYGGNFFDTLQ